MPVYTNGTVSGGGGSGTDPNALHKNVANEISTIPSELPGSGDVFIFEDLSDSKNKKRCDYDDIANAAGVTYLTALNDTFSEYAVDGAGYLLVQNSTNDGVDLVENTPSAVGIRDGVNLLHKLDATSSPLVTNDSSEGYSVGSRWLDVVNAEVFVCIDPSVDNAVWLQVDTSLPKEEIWSSPGTDEEGDIIVLKGGPLLAIPRGGSLDTLSGYDLNVYCNGVCMIHTESAPGSTEEFHYDSVNNEIDVYASGDIDRYIIVYRS